MKNNFKKFTTIITCIFLFITSFALYARAEIKYGNIRIYPEIYVQEMFRDNIYQTQRDKNSDFITTIAPSLTMAYLFGPNSFRIGYRAGFLQYARFSKNNYVDQNGFTSLNLRFPSGLDIDAQYDYKNSVRERTAEIARQRPYEESIGNLGVAYKFADRWKARAFWTYDDLAFKSDRFDRTESYTQNTYGAQLYYRLTARMSTLVEYNYIYKDFFSSDNSDHKDNLIYAGVAFDPAGKLKGELKGGYGWKKFKNSLAGRNNSPKTWIIAMNATQDFTKRTSLALNASRGFQDDTDFGNASYTATSVSLALQHMLTSKIGGVIGGGFSENAYLDDTREPVTNVLKKRTDKIWSANVGLFYNIQRWLEARLEYSYQDKDSNFQNYSFRENRVWFRVKFSP